MEPKNYPTEKENNLNHPRPFSSSMWIFQGPRVILPRRRSAKFVKNRNVTWLMVGQTRIEITKDQDLECLYWGIQQGSTIFRESWCKTQKTNQVLVDDLAVFGAVRNLMWDMFDEVSNMRLQELDLLLAPKFEIMLRAMQLLLITSIL